MYQNYNLQLFQEFYFVRLLNTYVTLELYKNSTVFFITHRLASLKASDHILVMDQGALVEKGTHEELMDLDGRYATLYHQQEM